ncbi:MAG: Na+/H+ antiporter NhaA [Actinomycetota bacterium]|nr:Na+/H+ antiporter NhaA [Actinomycetota bacterium]MEC8923790.1 Na+/H+ antiporter NhaA [Actinomycetota bacterium]MEC9339551.1 Na+/H+ antiporter NhaA [Actinomycetota bacterium]
MAGSDPLLKRPTFAGSDHGLAKFVARPVLRFIDREVAGGVLLLLATTAALIWANSTWADGYNSFWHAEIELVVGPWHLPHLSVGHFVNDALMALFFFVVGLEIKRELVTGDLRSFRAAALPAIGALGGMVVPAALYFALNTAGEASRGWGITMATDIAFAVGIVALLGARVSPKIKLFLLTLAIVDDIGAIVVIAIFYTSDLSLSWLLIALAGLVGVWLLQRLRVWAIPVYAALGIFIWYATLESGVHATIAGVALGLLTPARPLLNQRDAQQIVDALPSDASVAEVRHVSFLAQESVPLTERLENMLHPFTAFLIIPIFALANAGIELSGDKISDAASSNVTLGIVLGLVVGKPLGITLFAWVATRFGFALPEGVHWPQFVGMGFAAGIGFTVSIFVAGLAFESSAVTDLAKIGILIASLVAAVLALLLMRFKSSSTTE